MSKMLQIRNVPDDVHRALKVRAAREGVSLSDLALAELRKAAERPSRAELLERIRARGPIPAGSETPTESIRAIRDAADTDR